MAVFAFANEGEELGRGVEILALDGGNWGKRACCSYSA